MPRTEDLDYGSSERGVLEMRPTATSRDHKDGTAKSCENVPVNGLLGREVHLYPTPTSPGSHQVGTIGEWGGSGNPLRTPETMTLAGGSLNPQWVEWLMGYPVGWTDLKDSATPSSPKSPKSSDGQSSKRSAIS
jgi:DNA (cytosine-5)-methyltransferase 1